MPNAEGCFKVVWSAARGQADAAAAQTYPMLQSDYLSVTQLSGYRWSGAMHSMHGHVEQVLFIDGNFKSPQSAQSLG